MEAETVPDVTTEIHRWHEVLSNLPPALSEVEAIARITALEELTSAATAAQARETLTFDMHRRNSEAEDGVPSRMQGKSVGAEIALARKVSRARGSTLLKFSRSLLIDLPQTYSALKSGRTSEEKARAVAKETDGLPRDKRRQIDERMADRLAEVGVGRLGNEVRALAQQVDQKAAVEHLEKCTEERAVSVRPAPGNMAYLSALLPMLQAVAVYTNLKKSAASLIGTGDAGQRSQSQVIADLLVERTTGQECAAAVPTEIHLVMNDDSLVCAGEEPAWLPGFGPVPAGAARKFVAGNEAAVFLRRLYARPDDGQLVRMDSRRREFPGLLRRMIVIRDDVCRSPWCDAQIKHADHARAFAAGGDTDWDNASGLCAACNFVKELNGRKHLATPEKLIVKTPTGNRYETRTKPIDSRAGKSSAVDSEVEAAESKPGEVEAAEGEFDVTKRRRRPETSRAHGPPKKRRQPHDKPRSRRESSPVEFLFGEKICAYIITMPAE
ncbi:HNH endonuclease [Brevibacterium sp. FME37]|uniref:HNH endonuclease n=1 Tax=Brevibacterium sp. FME37 TaxID=2742607 RepID=UPI0018660D94|nr:DUF222 domain-containing protein [Brevibacterium sp. FME37]